MKKYEKKHKAKNDFNFFRYKNERNGSVGLGFHVVFFDTFSQVETLEIGRFGDPLWTVKRLFFVGSSAKLGEMTPMTSYEYLWFLHASTILCYFFLKHQAKSIVSGKTCWEWARFSYLDIYMF